MAKVIGKNFGVGQGIKKAEDLGEVEKLPRREKKLLKKTNKR